MKISVACFVFLFRIIDPQNAGGVKFVNIVQNFDGQAILKLDLISQFYFVISEKAFIKSYIHITYVTKI